MAPGRTKQNKLILDFKNTDIVPELQNMLAVGIQAPIAETLQLAHYFQKMTGLRMSHTLRSFIPESDVELELEAFSAIDEIYRVQFFLLPNLSQNHAWNTQFSIFDHWIIVYGPGVPLFDPRSYFQWIDSVPIIGSYEIKTLTKDRRKGSPDLSYFRDFYMFILENDLITDFE